MRLTGSFASTRGASTAPRPPRRGDIDLRAPHPTRASERVEVQNNGIDFDTERGASARAVFDGTVTAVVVMDGFQT